MTEYEREFDRLVHEYNRWFHAPVRQIVEHPLYTLFQMKKQVDDLPSHELRDVFAEYPCFYERCDLTVEQKAAIAIGSDLKRVEDKLNRGLVDLDELVVDVFKLFVQNEYTLLKNLYVTESTLKESCVSVGHQYPLTGDLMDSQPPGAIVKPS